MPKKKKTKKTKKVPSSKKLKSKKALPLKIKKNVPPKKNEIFFKKNSNYSQEEKIEIKKMMVCEFLKVMSKNQKS